MILKNSRVRADPVFVLRCGGVVQWSWLMLLSFGVGFEDLGLGYEEMMSQIEVVLMGLFLKSWWANWRLGLIF